MLDKNDLKAMKDLIDGSIEGKVPGIIDKKVPGIVINALGEFFEKSLAPYLDQITKRLGRLENDNDTFFRKLDALELQDDRILEKLDKIDDHMEDHGGRIKKLEKTLTTS